MDAASVMWLFGYEGTLVEKSCKLGLGEALGSACDNGPSLSVAEGLLERGANANKPEPNGNTPLMLAVRMALSEEFIRDWIPEDAYCLAFLRLCADRDLTNSSGPTVCGQLSTVRRSCE